MKTVILFAALLIFCGNSVAQTADYRVVFDMSTRDTISQQALLREVELIRTENPASRLEVVVYGQGLPMLLNDGSAKAKKIGQLLTDPNTSFKVCAFTMKRFNTDKSKLVPGVEVVKDGIYEIISKQREGWGYIKVAH